MSSTWTGTGMGSAANRDDRLGRLTEVAEVAKPSEVRGQVDGGR